MKPKKIKTIVVKEFDKIGWAEIIGEPSYHKIEPDQFKELENFIEENSDSESDERLSDFLRISSSRGKKVISPRNYVGVINIKNQVQIEILPKIDIEVKNHNEDNKDGRIGEDKKNKREKEVDVLRDLFLKMLGSLREFNHKSFKNAQLNQSNLPIYEVFIRMYLNEVRDLLKKGLKSDYVTFEGNLPYFKGKFLVNEHIKHNLVRKERFYMQYDEFHLNRPENKLIKATLLKLLKLSSSSENIRLGRQLLADFELIEPSVNYDKDFSAVRLDRNSKDYANLMTWSKVFLKNQSFSTFQGTNDVTALLFPMEKIFESYVAQEMVKRYDDWTVEAQKQSEYLFDVQEKFCLKPDIFLQRGEKKIVMDTKWKRLIDDKGKNYGISQTDMYQMYAYAYKYDVNDIYVIYPWHSELPDKFQKSFSQKEDEAKHLKKIRVTIFSLDLLEKEGHGTFNELKKLIKGES